MWLYRVGIRKPEEILNLFAAKGRQLGQGNRVAVASLWIYWVCGPHRVTPSQREGVGWHQIANYDL